MKRIVLAVIVSLFIGQINTNAQCPEAVDLGLSVKWASFNVGAWAPEEVGDYYAWGEIKTKEVFAGTTYRWYNSSHELLKYKTSTYSRNGDNRTVLELKDDIAHVMYGGQWRMPTMEEWEELMDNCNWLWTEVNGICGYVVTGINDNSIFLPASGHMDRDSKYEVRCGYYWSSSVNQNSNGEAHYLFFQNGYVGSYLRARSYGMVVRPVWEQLD